MKYVFVASALVVAACSRIPEEPTRPIGADPVVRRPLRAPTCPPDPDGIPSLPVYTLTVRETNVQFTCELVWKFEDTRRGLMYRTSMPDDHGMLFKLPRQVHSFWMHNTCISLDMLFVDTDGTIVGILESVPILNDAPRSVGKATPYVLELAGGAASKYGLVAGQHLEIPAEILDLAVPESP